MENSNTSKALSLSCAANNSPGFLKVVSQWMSTSFTWTAPSTNGTDLGFLENAPFNVSIGILREKGVALNSQLSSERLNRQTVEIKTLGYEQRFCAQPDLDELSWLVA